MNAEEQRRFGVQLAVKADAPKTLAVIKDINSSYEDIFNTAVSEMGAEKFASLIESEPEWAHKALLFVPDLDGQRHALVEASASYKDDIIEADAETADASGSLVATPSTGAMLELYEISGAAFECQFTMFWRDSNGNVQPNYGTPDQSQWKWSKKLTISINRSDMFDCVDFALPNSPLNPGDVVWMVVQVVCGGLYQIANLSFTYQPNAGLVRIDTWGASVNPQFGLHQGD